MKILNFLTEADEVNKKRYSNVNTDILASSPVIKERIKTSKGNFTRYFEGEGMAGQKNPYTGASFRYYFELLPDAYIDIEVVGEKKYPYARDYVSSFHCNFGTSIFKSQLKKVLEEIAAKDLSIDTSIISNYNGSEHGSYNKEKNDDYYKNKRLNKNLENVKVYKEKDSLKEEISDLVNFYFKY